MKLIVKLLFCFFIFCGEGICMSTLSFSDEINNNGKIKVGRFYLRDKIFDGQKVDSFMLYKGVAIEEVSSMSKDRFSDFVKNRWEEIKKKDIGKSKPPIVYNVSPEKIWFKYDFWEFHRIERSGKETNLSSYKSEGMIWNNNKLYVVARGGKESVDDIFPQIMEKINYENKGLCVNGYCLDVSPAEVESANITVTFNNLTGVSLMACVDNYDGDQMEYHSKHDFSIDYLGQNNVSTFIYSNPSIVRIMGDKNLEGEQRILGMTEKKGNGYYDTTIIANWYHPGTSRNPLDPSIEFTLSYKFSTKEAPSHTGWFDDETIKETGLAPEHFMSIWKATLNSFHRNG